MNYIVNNWALVIAVISMVVVAISTVLNFFEKPTEEQIKSIQEWLLFAVTSTERVLGSGTGKLKLRYAYDLFLTKFPALSRMISFDKFSDMVDDALDDMKVLISNNKQISNYVEGGATDGA